MLTQSRSPANGTIICRAAESKHQKDTVQGWEATELWPITDIHRHTWGLRNWQWYGLKWVRPHRIFKARSKNSPAWLPAERAEELMAERHPSPSAVWMHPAPATSSVAWGGQLGQKEHPLGQVLQANIIQVCRSPMDRGSGNAVCAHLCCSNSRLWSCQ